ARKRAAQAKTHRADIDAQLKAQAKKRADAERRKKDGIRGSVERGRPSRMENFVGGIIHKTLSSSDRGVGGMLAKLTGYDRTQGACINGSASAGIGFSGRGCLMVMQTSQGYQVGFAGSFGPSIGSLGAGITLDRYWSNAESYEDLRGWGAGAEASVGAPFSGRAAWGTGGVRTTDGTLVGEFELGVGADVFVADVSGGPAYTWIGEW
ncbi:hypothetical protein, partial [Streptomyces sp. NPDC055186]